NSVDFKFRGRFANGAVRGMMQAGKGNIVPAWMTATDVETLDRYRKPRATTGHSELIDAVGQEEPLADLLRFARRYKEQPAALEAYLALLPLLVGDAKSVDTLRPVLEAYVASGASWGPELAMRAEIDSALALAKAGGYPELGLEYIERAAPKINAESPAIWGMIVRRIRGQLLLEVGREDEGIEQLRIARGDNAFDPEITWLLSQHAQKNDKLEEALELLGELVAMPGLEGAILNIVAHGELSQGKKPPPQLVPSRLVERTWKLLKKPEGGVPKFLDEVYERKIHALAGERRPPRGEKEGNRVVLVELYTGAQCPPCVAADVATTALESTYSQSEVIVLRFHQHTPGPDPLANPDTLKRFAYYQGDSTPTLFLNGRNVDSVGGLLPAVPALLARLRSLVDPFLEEQIDLRLELSAVAKGNDVEIRAKGVGLPKFPAEVKLRLALAEEKIAMPAKNGIRIHDMVARKMPGEVDGISPNDGKLEFQETIDIAAFRTRIRGYLEHLEKETGEKFDRKPAEMTRLVLVGWLQNDDTGEVLQAAAVPVEGMLDPPAAVEAAVEPGEKKKPATDKKP
ncbi:MAG: hypothetical protein NT069_06915, partial [Planctomycetota bacterium]|nr:hypothetical protein [Planctomycetota bacterium]